MPRSASARCRVSPRGTRLRSFRRTRCGGSIPARAGEPSTRPFVLALSDGNGSIPARAGEPTAMARHMPAGLPARASAGLSPRVRGNPARAREPWTTCLSMLKPAGLSPRVRGNRFKLGDTNAQSSARVYPRACGGTTFLRTVILHDTGLSPRMRGNPVLS